MSLFWDVSYSVWKKKRWEEALILKLLTVSFTNQHWKKNLYFISIIFGKLTWTPGVAKWPAVLRNAWSHCSPRSTVQGSQNETLWTLIQRCESMEVSQWLVTPALLIFFSLLSAFLVSFLCSLSLVSDSSSNVCLKSCGSLGERTIVNIRKSLFWSEESWGNTIVFTNHENVGLHRQSGPWQRFMHWCFPHFGVQIKGCQP